MKQTTETREETAMTKGEQMAERADGLAVITYFGWAENAQGQIEQVKVERAKITGAEPNPHKTQTWTGRILTTQREAAVVTHLLNLLPPDVRAQQSGR